MGLFGLGTTVGSSTKKKPKAERNAIYEAIALCGLAGYHPEKTRRYLRTLPGFERFLAQEPDKFWALDSKFIELQKRRHKSYMIFIDPENCSPTIHRQIADDIMEAAGLTGTLEEDCTTPEEEIERWKKAWEGECQILWRIGQKDLGDRFWRDMIHTYDDSMRISREHRQAENLERFNEGTLQRMAVLAQNKKGRDKRYKNQEALLAETGAPQGAEADGSTRKRSV